MLNFQGVLETAAEQRRNMAKRVKHRRPNATRLGYLSQPMANLTKLLGITYVGKIQFQLFLHGPLAE